MTMLADKFVRLDRSSRRVLLTGLVVVAAVGLYRWILAPFSNQLLAAQRYNSVMDDSMRKARILGEILEAKEAKLKGLTDESVRLQNELFTPGEAREFFTFLPAAARKAGCVVASISQLPEQRTGAQNQSDDSGIVSNKAVVTVIGGYNEIVKFLGEMQTRKHRVWVDSVRMDAGAAGKLKCQVGLTIYCIERVETALYE